MWGIDPRDIRRILVRQVNWVGDAVLTLPALDALKQRFPLAEISLLAKPWVRDLFAGHPAVDRILDYRTEGPHRGIRGRWRLARELSQTGFDLAVVLPNSFDAAVIPWLAGIARRAGYPTDGRRWLLTHPIPGPACSAGRHHVERYLDIVRALGADGTASLRLPVTEERRQKSQRLLRDHGIGPEDAIVAVNPGSIYGSAKQWPAERFAAAADTLADRCRARIVLVGSERERPILEQVAAGMRRPTINLAGCTDLGTLVGLLSRADLLLSNDTGAMHIAAAAGTPVLAIFGPTSAQETGPLGACSRIVREAVPCSPCLLRECPIDHRCMMRVTVEQVCQVAVEVFESGRGGAGPGARTWIPASGSPAVFLDRDGTIIEDLGYLGDPAGIRFIPGALEALRALQRAGFRLVLVTNQAGVARGLISEADVRRVNERLRGLLAEAGMHLDGIYYCPHHPEYGPPEYRRDCECRKPKPGMVRQALRDLGLDPSRSVIIGDHASDAELARAFPGMQGVMLRTGHGAQESEKIQRGELPVPDHVAEDLPAAVDWLLARAGKRDGIGSRPA